MRYFEIKDPYYALIAVVDKGTEDEAKQEMIKYYEENISDFDECPEDKETITEVTEEYARNKFVTCVVKYEGVAEEKALETFKVFHDNNPNAWLVLIDGNLL